MNYKPILVVLIILFCLVGFYTNGQSESKSCSEIKSVIEQPDNLDMSHLNEENMVSFESSPDCVTRPGLKIVSVYTDKYQYTENENVNVYIKNNRNRVVHGLYGSTLFAVILIETREVVYQTFAPCCLSTMEPHEVHHHVWNQRGEDNSTRVTHGRYLIFGGFPPHEDVAYIEILPVL